MSKYQLNLKDENRVVNNIALVINISLIIFFFVLIIKGAHSFPVIAYDDINFFLVQFQDDWIEKSDLWSKFSFLFQQSNWPHANLLGRIATLTSYYFIGEVNFKFLTYFGSIGILGLWLSLYKTINIPHKPVIFIVVTYFLFFLNPYVFWPVASIGGFYSICFTYLAIYFFCNNKYILAATLAFFATFSGGVGIFTFLVLIFLFLINKTLKKDLHISKKELSVSMIIMMLAGFLFFFITLEGSFRTQQGFNLPKTDPIDIIQSLSAMTFSIIGLFTDVVFSPTDVMVKFLAGIIIILFFITLIIMIWKRDQSIINPLIIFAAFLIFKIFSQAYLRDNVRVIFENPLQRRIYTSILFFVVTYLICYRFFHSKYIIKISYFLFSSIIIGFIPFRMKEDIKNIKLRNYRIERAYKNFTKGDLDKSPFLLRNTGWIARSALLNAQCRGIITLPGYYPPINNYLADSPQNFKNFSSPKLFEKYNISIDEVTFQQNFHAGKIHYTNQVSLSEGCSLYYYIYIDKPHKSGVIGYIKNTGITILYKQYRLNEIGIIEGVPVLFNEEDQIIVFPGAEGVNVFINQNTAIKFGIDDFKEIFGLSFK